MYGLDRRLEDFLDAMDQSETDDDIWRQTLDAARSVGFGDATYLYYPDACGKDLGAALCRSSYPEEWLGYWFDRRYNEADITFALTMKNGRRAMRFDIGRFLARAKKVPPLTRAALSEAHAQIGFKRIIAFQLFRRRRGLGGLAFVSDTLSSREFAALPRDHRLYLSAVCHIAHSQMGDGMSKAVHATEVKLSGRQKDILAGIVSGKRQKQIAWELGISTNTVAYHVAQLRRKLGCCHSNEIVAAAYRHGLLHHL